MILTKAVESTRQGFDKIPTPAKIIIYSGIAVIVTTLTADLDALSGWYVKYLSIGLGVLANLVAWLLLSLKEENK